MCIKSAATWLLLVLPVVYSLVPAVSADDFNDYSFSLRLPAGLSRFSSYADVAGIGGASAGSKWSSSMNPAAVAWGLVDHAGSKSISPQYSQICFDEGAKLFIPTASVTWDLGAWGVIQPATAIVRSNTSRTREGMDFDFEMNYYQMSWGKKISSEFAIGGAFNYATSQTDYSLDGMGIAKSNSDSYGFRAGGLYQVQEHLLAGLVIDYGFSVDRTVQFDFMHLGIGDQKSMDTTQQVIVRPGLSYEYKKDSAIYFDYQFGSFSNDTGTLNVNRFYAGIDHGIWQWLFIRAGTNLDIEGHTAWSAGLGIYPTNWLSFDVAYQQNMFPELKPDFGNSQALVISVSLLF